MKPITFSSLSAWGYIGLFILFNLPYVGTPALIICALFSRNYAVKNFARALLILTVLSLVFLLVLGFLGFYSFSDILEDFYFDFSGDEGTVFINTVRYYIGI